MLAGHDWSRTRELHSTLLVLTKDLPRYLGLSGVIGLARLSRTVACVLRRDTAGVRRPREIGTPGRSRTYTADVRSVGPVSVGRDIGRPPGCRTQPFQAVRPVSGVYKAPPRAGAVDKIGSELPSCTASPRYERGVTLVHLLASKWLRVMESDHRRSAYETDVLPLN